MEADGEGDYFNEIAEEELSRGSGHLGVDEDMFPDFRKHGEVPLKLPAGVHDEDHGEVQPVQAEDEAAQEGTEAVQQGVEPLLPGPPVREGATVPFGHGSIVFREISTKTPQKVIWPFRKTIRPSHASTVFGEKILELCQLETREEDGGDEEEHPEPRQPLLPVVQAVQVVAVPQHRQADQGYQEESQHQEGQSVNLPDLQPL